MITRKKILSLAEELLNDELFLVELEVATGNRITVVLDSIEGVNVNNCIAMSRHIENNLDRDEEDFELQVYSAGLDQPFKVHRQYIKNIGREIEVVTSTHGEKYSGVLETVDEDRIVLKIQRKERLEGKKKKVLVEEDVTIQFKDIKTAKVVISFK